MGIQIKMKIFKHKGIFFLQCFHLCIEQVKSQMVFTLVRLKVDIFIFAMPPF